VAEVAAAGHDHCRAGIADGLEHLAVSLRAAWLDDRRDPGLERDARTVREGEEGVRGEHGPLERVTELAGLVHRDADGVDAARLPAADAERLPSASDHDRVGDDVLGDRPREEEVVPHRGARVAADDVHRIERIAVRVAVLDEQAAEDTLEVALARDEAAALGVGEDADPRLGLERGQGPTVVAGTQRIGAELQIQILWREMLKRRLRPEIVGEPVRLYSNFIRGIRSLPVVIRG